NQTIIPVKQSAHSNEPALAAANNAISFGGNGEMHQTCARCQAEIVDGHWFCRLPGNARPTLLCSPSCALRYFDRTHVERNGSDRNWESDESRFHFFINGEQT